MVSRCLRSFFRVCNLKMSSASNVAFLPNNVRGMKELDREKFLCNIKVAVVRLSLNKVFQYRDVFKPYFLKLEHFKPLQCLKEGDTSSPYRCVHLNPHKIMCWTDFTEDERRILNDNNITEADLSHRKLQLSYENFTYDEIFKVVLPEDQEKVSSFSQIGHIIHLNLRDHLLEYKTLIGAVLLDKVPNCQTVVNKLNNIDNKFRTFAMEVIAGKEDFVVTVKENYCLFEFDFSKVYWNPRLGNEHVSVVDCMKRDDVLFDAFCGVGPFAIPAGKKKCRVFANDLNPESYHWLNHNVKKNKVGGPNFKTFNMDAKDFISTVFKEFIEDCCKGNEVLPTDAKIHVTMNLPALAVEFLKYFNGLIDDMELKDKFNLDIIVHVYCFSLGEKSLENAKQLVIENMHRNIASDILGVFFVRNVAPKKDMIKVSLRLTKETLFGANSDPDLTEPVSKKRCVGTDMIK